MHSQNASLASVTNFVDDFMFVEINGRNHVGRVFEYRICSHDVKLIRKGRFSGPNVQLRLSLIEEGKYFFQLYLDDEQLQNSRFEKMPRYYYNFNEG